MSRNKGVAKEYIANKEDKKDGSKQRSNNRNRNKRRNRANVSGSESKAIQNRQGYVSNPESDKEFKGVGLNSKGRDNDPSWYFTNSELAEQASQLSFQSVLGLGTVLGYEVPTFMLLKMAPCPGCSYSVTTKSSAPGTVNFPASLDLNSGINITAAKTFSLLSTFTGRAATAYMPGDVAMMELAIANVAEWSEYIRRFFGIVMTTTDRNRFLPYELIDAMGVDPVDLRANIANYRMRFNIAMARINQIPLLDNIGYIRKSREMYQKIYMDAMSPMSQYIAMIPDGYWYLDETGNAGGTSLVYHDNPITGAGKSMDAKLHILENMIDKLLSSSTLNIVYADLLNLANKVKVATWQFDYLSENYVVLPEYNRNFLLQLHNLDIIGSPVKFTDRSAPVSQHSNQYYITSDNCVYQDVSKNAVIYNPIFKPAIPFNSGATNINNGSYLGTIIDMDVAAPTMEDRIEALRFSALRSGYCNSTSSSAVGYAEMYDTFVALPDHYCTSIFISKNIANVNNPVTSNYYIDQANVNPGYLVNDITKFEWAPHLYGTASSAPYQSALVIGELNFYTEIDFNYLSRLNKMITVGLFDFRV